MEYYEITHIDGTKGKIGQEQALRISKMMFEDMKTPKHRFQQMKQKNHQYKEKAQRNIKNLSDLEECPQTEQELKKIMYEQMPNLSYKEADLLYEIIEMAIALYFNKVGE